MKKYLFLVFLFSGLGSFSQIQPKSFSLAADFRSRFEYRDGYKRILSNDEEFAAFFGQRSRLILNFTSNKLLSNFSFQEAGIWGENEWLETARPIGIYQAWVEYIFSYKRLSLKIGRQELEYDDGRLLSKHDWEESGATHDIAVLKYCIPEKDFCIHNGMGINAARKSEAKISYNVKNYKYLAFLWANKQFWDKKLDISATAIADGNEKQDTLNIIYTRGTFGSAVKFMKNKLKLKGSYFHQLGKNKEGKNVNTYFYSGSVNYQPFKSLNTGIGLDNYSGTNMSNPNSQTQTETFDILFGDRHNFLGSMDYFQSPADFITGIKDFHFKMKLQMNWVNRLDLTYHYFTLNNRYIIENQILTKLNNMELGHEFDFFLHHTHLKEAIIQAGYSFIIPSETMNILKANNPNKNKFANFFWISVQFTPTFFESTKN
ncbi:MAG: alginate export family protein [Saprospiraceae bacterium]|nr:alginate export family protein [Saprospiraceae bacterium]